MPFTIGTRVIVLRDALHPLNVGAVTIVTSELVQLTRPGYVSPRSWEGEWVHRVALDAGRGRVTVYRPKDLARYRADDRKATRWTDELRKLCLVEERA